MPPSRCAAPTNPRRTKRIRTGIRLAAALLPLLAAGCASLAGGPPGDPLEPFNRKMFGFNDGLQRHLMQPTARGYRAALPEPARDGVRNFMRNLRTPVILANDLLQLELRRAGDTLGRFVVNSTMGVGGVYDVGERFGMDWHDEDFGQTLAVWGMPQGPYLVLPFLGSMSPRAGVGMAADSYLSPWSLWLDRITRFALSAVDTVDSYSRVMDPLEELRETSVDFYGAVRSLYLQRREEEIRNGRDDQPGSDELDYGLELDHALGDSFLGDGP